MQRITITIEPELLDQLDAFMAQSGATNRSEALRDLVRLGLSGRQHGSPAADCLAVVSYALDPPLRDLARRVPQGRQDRHDRTLAALSVPVDHAAAVEVAVLRGSVAEVSAYANGLFLERGIRHGTLALIPVRVEDEVHSHADGAAHRHSHLRVQESF
jgi:CopG family nickel-responsive transcriptional regulator